MSGFRTIVEPEPSNIRLDHTSNIMMLGSCFTENIGEKLSYAKFNSMINPFGIIFHPTPVAQSVRQVLNAEEINPDLIISHNNLWHSLLHHGKFSNEERKIVVQEINAGIKEAHNFIKNTDVLILTFGTAWGYRHKQTDTVVANCHKIPQSEFEKELTGVEEIYNTYNSLISDLLMANDSLKIIFTVSPVRHWKDGAVQNQRSKANLIEAIHRITDHYNDIEYFPSYEMMMDDLRDYRFYADDMLHPSKKAVNYIWDKFQDTYMDTDTQSLIIQCEKMRRSLEHKIITENTEERMKFYKSLQKQVEKLKKEGIDFTPEYKKVVSTL